PEMGLPGQEYFAGTHVNPQVTWWNQSGAFIDYMHRTQSLVQNGKFVADVLYYYGDHVPNVFSIKATDPAGAMPGYDYDVCDETILLQLKMKKNKIVVPGGIEYEVLVLPDHRTLSMSALKKVEELLKNGAQVIGDKPEQLVSRVGGEGAQEEFHALADEIWGGDNGEEDEGGETGEERYGKGYLAWGITAREYLLSKDIPKDFVVLDGKDQADFDYIHYTIDQADVYFITNQTTDRKLIDCQFRVSELQPELWDAITGEIREAKAFTQKDGLTNVSLTLEPYGAVFVVFSKEIKETQQGAEERNYHDFESLQTINGEWKVNFDPKWGPFDSSTLRPLDPNQKPGAFIFPELIDWTQHSHEAIKYYSGSAVYQKFIDLEFELKEGQKYYLQLGSVKDVGIAVVKVNGQDLGVTWTSPFRVDVSDVLKPGRNELEIKVINSWYNRVAGDEILELEQAYTSTNIILAHDFRGQKIENVQLEPSGLMGPVELLQEKQN
ncbi:MAG: glycoside hydrolase, partial [Bacteroidales bacterium]|nr:glycoside hydrolase [Bacteroidales bacterium]